MDGQLQFIQLEVMVVALGLLVLLADLFLSESVRRSLGYFAAGALGLVFLLSFCGSCVGLVDDAAFTVIVFSPADHAAKKIVISPAKFAKPGKPQPANNAISSAEPARGI